jgi:hypothetical protein
MYDGREAGVMSDKGDPWDSPSAEGGQQPPQQPDRPAQGGQPEQPGGLPGWSQPAEPAQQPAQQPQQPTWGQPAQPQQPAWGQPRQQGHPGEGGEGAGQPYSAYPPPPPPPAYGYGQPQQPAYGAQPYYGGPQTSGKATTVLVLGIASLVLMFTCGLGFIAAIVALVMAKGARREIRESGGRLTGESQIKAGVIMSWITIGLTAVGLVAVIALFAVGVSSDSSSDGPRTPVETSIGAPARVAG